MTLIYISQLSIRLFSSGVSVLMRVIPQRYRFRAAVGILRMIPHDLRHTLSPRLERRPGISSMREAILGTILTAMDYGRVRFDPMMTVSGLELIHEALDEHRGVLLVGTHANGVLARAALRLLYDANVSLTVISIKDLYPICGAGIVVPAIRPNGNLMVKVRTRLRNAHVVCGMIDAFKPSAQQTLELRGSNGSIWASDSLIRVALACNATIIFAAARLARNGRLVITFQAASEVKTPEDCWHQLIPFFEQHMTNT